MKIPKISAILLIALTICAQANAKEIELQCKGVEIFSEKHVVTDKSQKNYVIVFDDVKKTIPIMTVGLAKGCFKSEHLKSTKCECKVTEREISCESSATGITNPSLSTQQSFTINRFSGQMNTYGSMMGKTGDGQDFYSSTAGDLSCEVLTKKKF
jgi:hypothetical protein